MSMGPLLARDGRLEAVQAPFHLRNLPAFRDMKGFALPARGGLNFVAAGALEFDPRRVERAGFAARILATTTEHARALPLPAVPFTDADLEAAPAVPRQSLMLLLEARDPWSGPLLLLASASPLRDGIFNQSGYGHSVEDDFNGHVPNTVTSLLAAYRGFDTMFETTVIFVAGVSLLLLLRRRREGDPGVPISRPETRAVEDRADEGSDS